MMKKSNYIDLQIRYSRQYYKSYLAKKIIFLDDMFELPLLNIFGPSERKFPLS
jgi:hypothetical protein